jgi:hypothetical protein
MTVLVQIRPLPLLPETDMASQRYYCLILGYDPIVTALVQNIKDGILLREY